MKITSFKNLNKQQFDQLRHDITKELAQLGEKYGVVFRAGNIQYLDGSATIKVEASCLNSSGEVRNKEAEDFKSIAPMYGFKPEDLGRKFHSDNKIMEIAGWLRSNRTKQILLKDQNGKQYKSNAESVKQRLLMFEVK